MGQKLNYLEIKKKQIDQNTDDYISYLERLSGIHKTTYENIK